MPKTIRFFILIFILTCALQPVMAQDVVSDIFARINNLRASLGLEAYNLNAALSAAAQNHANWMVNTGQVSHTQENGSRPVDRANTNGYNSNWVSENIYMGGIATADDAWNFWINSSIHYAGLTNVNYQDVGIATASGTHGHSFVLVFGNRGGFATSNTAGSSNNSSNNASSANSAPLPIVGYDEVGNIRYQLQAGETLGDVLLIFGYTWDELPELMELNGFTEADIRSLDVGQEILVPPYSGTWTPTPASAEATAEVTAEASQEVTISSESTESLQSAAIVISPSPSATANNGIIPTPQGSDSFIVANPSQIPTNTEAPIEQLAPPAVFSGASPSPSPSPSASPSATSNLEISTLAATSVAMVITPIVEVEMPQREDGTGIPLWLIGAIVIQVGVLGYASFEFLRRMVKRK